MPININTLWNAIGSNTNKTQSAFMKPSVFDDLLWQVIFQLFNEKCMEAGRNGKIRDDIAPFLKLKNVMVQPFVGNQYSLVVRPADFIYFSAMSAFFIDETKENCPCPGIESDNECSNKWGDMNVLKTKTILEKTIEEVEDYRWSGMLNHSSRCPTKENPKFSRYDVGFRVAPKDISIVTLSYYREPVRPKWNYKQAGDYFEFDPIGSVNVEFGTQCINEIVQRFNQLFAISIREGELFQSSTLIKNTTS